MLRLFTKKQRAAIEKQLIAMTPVEELAVVEQSDEEEGAAAEEDCRSRIERVWEDVYKPMSARPLAATWSMWTDSGIAKGVSQKKVVCTMSEAGVGRPFERCMH